MSCRCPRGGCIRVVTREREERVIWVGRIDGDATHETSRRRRVVDAVEGNVRRRRVVCIGSDEYATAPQARPKRAIVASSPCEGDDVLTGCFVGPESSATQIGTDRRDSIVIVTAHIALVCRHLAHVEILRGGVHQ